MIDHTHSPDTDLINATTIFAQQHSLHFNDFFWMMMATGVLGLMFVGLLTTLVLNTFFARGLSYNPIALFFTGISALLVHNWIKAIRRDF